MHVQSADVRGRPRHCDCRSYNEKLSIDKPLVIEAYPQVSRDNRPYIQTHKQALTTTPHP